MSARFYGEKLVKLVMSDSDISEQFMLLIFLLTLWILSAYYFSSFMARHITLLMSLLSTYIFN